MQLRLLPHDLCCRTRRRDRFRREDRVFDPRHLAGERMQELHDGVDLARLQLRAELRAAHHGHGLLQIPDLARVEVGRRDGDVPQGCCAEHILIVCSLGDLEPALIIGRQHLGAGLLDYTEGIIAVATHVDAAVARGASLFHEVPKSCFLHVREREVVAIQVFVEGRGRDQSRLEGLNRDGHVIERHGIVFVRERGFEPLDILRHAAERRDNLLGCVRHLDAGLDRTFGLSSQILGAAVPELRIVEYGIEDGRRVSRPFLPSVADRRLEVVITAGREVVARVATEDAARRQPRIEEQRLAELDLLFRDAITLDGWNRRRQRLEDRGGEFSQILGGKWR